MENSFGIFVILGILCVIYFFTVITIAHKRVKFYESITEGALFQCITYKYLYKNRHETFIYPLEIISVKLGKDNYADIKFDNIMYKDVPFSKIYYIIHEYDAYEQIYNTLKAYN